MLGVTRLPSDLAAEQAIERLKAALVRLQQILPLLCNISTGCVGCDEISIGFSRRTGD